MPRLRPWDLTRPRNFPRGDKPVRIPCPAEIEILWLSDWRYYQEFRGRAVTVVQLEVRAFPNRYELIAELLGVGMRLNVTTEHE